MVKFLGMDRSVIAILAGYAIEKYDMFLYGFFTIVIGELFFPDNFSSGSKIISSVFGLGIFAAGYILRPLGGIFFGHLGDKLGRKKALLISLGLSSLSPLLLSILPTYKQIGIIAPICLLLCRIFQGFCSGGEFSGASVFLQEHSRKNRLAFSISLLRSVGFLGVAFGMMVAYLSTLPGMPAWGWRIPFGVGTCLSILFYFIRLRNMVETSSFQKIKNTGSVASFPLIELFKHSKMRLLCAIALSVYASISYYMSTIYTGSILKTEFNMPNHHIMAVNMGIVLFWVIAIPLLGVWADKMGVRRFLVKALWGNITLVYPLFWIMEKYFSFTTFMLFQLMLGLLCASFYAPFAALLPKIFPVRERYSGVAFSITLVQAVLGGITPLVSALLVFHLGDKKAPAFFLITGALVALRGIAKIKQFPPAIDTIKEQKEQENLVTPAWRRTIPLKTGTHR